MKNRMEFDTASSAPVAKPDYRLTGHLPDVPALNKLKARPQWVAWDYEWKPKKSKWDKVPKRPGGGNASVSNPSTWGTYDEAFTWQQSQGLTGIGYVLTEDDNIIGIDVDDCRGADWFEPLIEDAETYAETSPSGEGARMFAIGEVKTDKCDAAGVEIYTSGRYLTVTGHQMLGTPDDINPAPRTLKTLKTRVDEFKAIEAEKKAKRKTSTRKTPPTSAAKIDTGSNPFWRAVNTAALADLDAWVPSLFPEAEKHQTGAYRISSDHLGRNLEEDLSIHPDGVQDFGEEEPRTALDLVQEFGGAPDAKAAAFWICEKLRIEPATLGWRDLKAERKERAEVFKANPPDINPEALRLAKRIARGVMQTLPDLHEEPFIDPLIIRDMIEGAFWSGAKSRMFLLNEAESLIQFPANEAWKFLCRRFGTPHDPDEIVGQLGELKPSEEAKAHKAIAAAVIGPVIDFLKYQNQRDAIEWTVDMFGDRARLELQEDVAKIVLTHQPAADGSVYTRALVDDYKQHFPELDLVIEFIVASRFALDRKKSYLWLLADSDWGKGFFLGVLEKLGLVVQMSVKEIESMFEGKPAGRSPADFKRAMILAVDEFKTVKSELKQLQSEIPLAPKYQLTSRVEVFTKLFLSAESVGSLVGEHGVEDQFANRMSMVMGRGSIMTRPAYAESGGRYFRSVKSYVAQEINRLVDSYRADGKEGAERRAERFLTAFIDKHGLGQHFTRLSESVQEIADDAVRYFQDEASGLLMSDSTGGRYLPHAGKRLQDYLEERFEKAEIGTLRRRKLDIQSAMSADGRGVTAHRLGGRLVKAIKLKP